MGKGDRKCYDIMLLWTSIRREMERRKRNTGRCLGRWGEGDSMIEDGREISDEKR